MVNKMTRISDEELKQQLEDTINFDVRYHFLYPQDSEEEFERVKAHVGKIKQLSILKELIAARKVIEAAHRYQGLASIMQSHDAYGDFRRALAEYDAEFGVKDE